VHLTPLALGTFLADFSLCPGSNYGRVTAPDDSKDQVEA
jgi:hypothetical protein